MFQRCVCACFRFCCPCVRPWGGMLSARLPLSAQVNILRDLRHPFVVRYYDRIIDKANTKIYIVMEFCEGGDLGRVIRRAKREGCVCIVRLIPQLFRASFRQFLVSRSPTPCPWQDPHRRRLYLAMLHANCVGIERVPSSPPRRLLQAHPSPRSQAGQHLHGQLPEYQDWRLWVGQGARVPVQVRLHERWNSVLHESCALLFIVIAIS